MKTTRTVLRWWVAAFASASALAAIGPSVALAAPPAYTSIPQIEGPADVPFVGDTLTATNGAWTGNPTSFTYQWDRCNALGDRQNCVPISGATSKSYTVQSADVGHTLDVRVTAKNADGSTTNNSKGTGIVSGKAAPKNYVSPRVSGTATIGNRLSVTGGTWAGATTIADQWRSCDSTGNGCVDISGATNSAYTVRAADLGHTLRAQVTATNKYGSTKLVTDQTAVVTTGIPPSTTVVTTTVPEQRPPALSFLSLRVRSNHVFVRFRVCTASARVTITDRDQHARRLAYTRRFTVHPVGCSVFARHWLLIPRFRAKGRFVVSLRAVDPAGRLSRLVSRSVVFR